MISTPKKQGRPTAFHRMTDGTKIDGLSKLADGRWKVSPGHGIPKAIKFSERDENLAVARFYELRDQATKPAKVRISVGTYNDPLQATLAGLQAWGEGHKDVHLQRRDGLDGATTVTVGKTFDSPEYWHWLRHKLVTDAKWVSERVGIDLTNLKPPPSSVKLSALIDTYAQKPTLSLNEASRSKLFWSEFTKAVGAMHVREVGHDQIIAYEKAVQATGLATKSVLHRYAKIKTVFAYAIKRGLDIEGCRRALDAAAMLDSGHCNQNDPDPIAPASFWKIYGAAMRANDSLFKAIMLVSLNAAMYGGEVAALKWDEVNLRARTLVTRRPKTGVSRVAILWPETVAALRRVPAWDGIPFVFNTSRRSFTSNSVLKAWRSYRSKAGFGDETTFGQIRDAAYSIACQSATLDQARALAGHRFPGMSDAYVRRRPDFVGPACDAIRESFSVAKQFKRKFA